MLTRKLPILTPFTSPYNEKVYLGGILVWESGYVMRRQRQRKTLEKFSEELKRSGQYKVEKRVPRKRFTFHWPEKELERLFVLMDELGISPKRAASEMLETYLKKLEERLHKRKQNAKR